jgi:hypothetical protein
MKPKTKDLRCGISTRGIVLIRAYILAWFLLGLWAVYSSIFLLQFATC